MRFVRLGSVFLLLFVSRAMAEITVLPSSGGNAVAIASSKTEGRWLVLRGEPLGVVTGLKYLKGEDTVHACYWEGEAGKYIVVLIPTDATSPMETAEVVLGGAPTPPEPPTPPTPPTPPDVPEGHLGFTKGAFDAAIETVTNEEAYKLAGKIAANYLDVAKGLRAETPVYPQVADAFDDLKKKNQLTLPEGPLRDAWAVFGSRMSNRIDPLWPFDRSEAANILEAIGKGLEYASNYPRTR